MSIFSKKQGVKLEEFCHDFYEKNILNPLIAGIDAGAVYYEKVKKLLVEVDQNFANINSQLFANEIIILRFELFSLAWLHHFGDKLAVAHSFFTKHYLQENRRDDIWDASESYNQAIARSSTIGKKPEEPFDRVYLARVMKTRADLFEQYYKEGCDPKCIARPLNRLFSDKAWEKGITAGLLMLALCDRLGFEHNYVPNKEVQFRFTAVIHGLYDGARQSLENIKIKS